MATIDVEELVSPPNAQRLVGDYIPPYLPVDTGAWAPAAFEAGLGASEEEAASVAYINGVVRDIEGAGCARQVWALKRTDGVAVGQTTSGPSGVFTIFLRTLEPVILFAVPLDGEQLNAVVLDNILPVPI